MKKSLVALAALAVVGAASAQSTVTMYGLIDLSVTNQNDKVTLNGANIDASKNSVKSGVLNGSRIGFKGTEDLGGGLKANFVLEYSVQPDEGSAGTTMANRQSFVGLSGGFGALTIGRQYTPYYSVVGVLDQAGVIDAPGMVVNAHFLGGLRRDNAIQYVSPSFGGVTATVQVAAGNEAAFGTGVANTAAGKSFGGSVVYAAGPLVAGLIYDKVTAPAVQLVNYTSVTGAGAAAIPLFGTPGASDDTSVWAVGALYDFGVAKASLAYSSLTDKFVAGGNDLTSKGYNLSVSVPFGATSVYGNLGRADVVQTGGIDAVLTGFQLGANYSLSKRTTAYAVYGSDTLTQAGVTGEAKRAQTSVGIRHTF